MNSVEEDDLICAVEHQSALSAETAPPKDAVERIRVGQSANLKVRGLPCRTLHTHLERIAVVAESNTPDSRHAPTKPEKVS